MDAPAARIAEPRAWFDRQRGQIEVVALGAILVAVAIAAAWLIGQATPLGWDEAVYASRSRSLLTDAPSSTWAIYRAPGLPVVGLIGGAFGFTDANLRAVALAMSLGSLAMAWAFARTLWGPLAAIIALLTIVGSPVVIAELVLFHTDLPAAGLLLALMLLVWHEFERRPEPGRLLLVAAPLAALAFYVRYGSILPIGGIAIAAVLLWHRAMLRNPRLVGATIAFRRRPVRATHPRGHEPDRIAARDHHERRRAGRHVGADRDGGSVSRVATGPARPPARVRGDGRGCRARRDRRPGRDPTARPDAGRTSLPLVVRPGGRHDVRARPAVAPGAALRAVPCDPRDHRRSRGGVGRGRLAPGPARPGRPAARPGRGDHRRTARRGGRRGLGRGAARRRDRTRKRRFAVAAGRRPADRWRRRRPVRRGDLGTADRRVVLALRRRRSSAPPGADGPRRREPSTTRPMSCSRTSTNAGLRPRPSSAIERLWCPGPSPWTARPPRSRSTASHRERNFVLDGREYSGCGPRPVCTSSHRVNTMPRSLAVLLSCGLLLLGSLAFGGAAAAGDIAPRLPVRTGCRTPPASGRSAKSRS